MNKTHDTPPLQTDRQLCSVTVCTLSEHPLKPGDDNALSPHETFWRVLCSLGYKRTWYQFEEYHLLDCDTIIFFKFKSFLQNLCKCWPDPTVLPPKSHYSSQSLLWKPQISHDVSLLWFPFFIPLVLVFSCSLPWAAVYHLNIDVITEHYCMRKVLRHGQMQDSC